jgi:hypothetical protein
MTARLQISASCHFILAYAGIAASEPNLFSAKTGNQPTWAPFPNLKGERGNISLPAHIGQFNGRQAFT